MQNRAEPWPYKYNRAEPCKTVAIVALEVTEEDVPDGNDVADASGKDKEVEHAVHIPPLVQRVEQGTRDVAHTFGYNPHDGGCRHGVEQRLEGHKHRKSHQHETNCFHVAVLLQPVQADDGASDGCRPHEDEERPPPQPFLTQGDERQGRVAACYMPVDGRVIPFAQSFLPLRMGRQGMIGRRGDIAAQHAEEVENDADAGPVAVALDGHGQKDDANGHPKQDAAGNALAGAEFTISGANIDEAFTANGGVTTVTSGADGKVTFTGLAAGTYTVKETMVPHGFLQNVKPEFTVTIDKDGNVSFTQDAWHLVDPQTVTVKNVKSVTQLPLTGAAGITMLIVVALLLGGAAALIGVRSHSLKRQLTA